MAKTPLVKKLGIKPKYKVKFINEPDNYLDLLGYLPEDVEIIESDTTDLDFIHIFTNKEAELKQLFAKSKLEIKMNGMIWVSWYKKSAKKPTEIHRDIVRTIGLDMGLVDVKVCSVSEDWSGIKFMYRIKDRK